MNEMLVEIRAGEGGEDSRLFVHDMFSMYCAYCTKNGMNVECL